MAVSKSGRIFFTFHPKGQPYVKVAEWHENFRSFAAYPNNSFQQFDREGGFDTVLSLRVDAEDRLWVLDQAREGRGQPCLYAFDLTTNEVLLKHDLRKEVAPDGSSLNGLSFLFLFFCFFFFYFLFPVSCFSSSLNTMFSPRLSGES